MSWEPSVKELLIDHLGAVLQLASDHLEYCNYGDKWERECAETQHLKPKIAGALEAWNKHKRQSLLRNNIAARQCDATRRRNKK